MKKSIVLMAALIASSMQAASKHAKTEDQIVVVNKTSSYIVTVSGTREVTDITKKAADVVINPSITSSTVQAGLILPAGQSMTISAVNKMTGKPVSSLEMKRNANAEVYEVKVSLGKMSVTGLTHDQADKKGYLVSYK